MRLPALVAFTTFSLLAAAPATSFAQAKPALDDPAIVGIFDAANGYDIATGSLAAKKGASASVKEFGAMLAKDHTGVRQMGRDLAAKLKVTPTPVAKDFALSTGNAEALKTLNGLNGAAFDKAFLEHEVAYHNAVIDAVTKTLLPAIQNAELKALVEKVAPAFVAHRDAAANMLKMMKAN
jgi:putative membrane protein